MKKEITPADVEAARLAYARANGREVSGGSPVAVEVKATMALWVDALIGTEAPLALLGSIAEAGRVLVEVMHAERVGNEAEWRVAMMAGRTFAEEIIAASKAGRVPLGTILAELIAEGGADENNE